MKIVRVRIDAFGRLRNVDTGEVPLGRLVVVLGPNEAGKSTLFHFLTTLLFGFRLANCCKEFHLKPGKVPRCTSSAGIFRGHANEVASDVGMLAQRTFVR